MTDINEVLERRRQRFAEAEPLDEDEERSTIFTEAQNEVLALIIARVGDVAGDEAEKALRASTKALREEAQVELALVRDELNGRIDQKLFGSGLDVDAEELRRTMFELKSDATKRFDAISALLDKLAERIDAVDKRRRYDRNTAHKEHAETAEKVAALFAAMTAKTDEKLKKIAADLADLEAKTAEAFADDGPGRRAR